MTDGRCLKRSVNIINNRGRTFHPQDLRYNQDYFEVQLVPLTREPVKKYRIEVVPRLERLPAGITADNLIVKTGALRAKEVKISLSILIEK